MMEFNSLPREIHLEIFTYLPFEDVMKIRRTCKQWNRLVNSELKFKRLLYRHRPRSFLVEQPPEVQYLKAFLRANYAQSDAFDFLNSF